MADQTDAELVEQIRSGDPEGYSTLVARYQGHVYGLAYSLVNNWADAQDVAQETFIRAYVNLDQLKDPARFAPWLRRVTFGIAMDWLRAYRPAFYQQIESQVDLDSLEVPDFAPGPQEVIERKELAEAIQRAIASLPPKYQVPLTMFHLDGLSVQKVADFLDIPLGTAKSLIHRAREKLRVALGSYYSEEVGPMMQEVFNEHKLPAEWTKEVYEKSVSSRCWWFTPLDGGQWNDLVSADDELRQIVAMEQELGEIPDWAREIVQRVFYYVPGCGHYLFPQPFLEVVDAIGAQAPPAFLHGCYTADKQRKEQMVDYIFCLDAWLAGAESQDAARELTGRERGGRDWNPICSELWQVLGEHTELKDLLVERLLLMLRWGVKAAIWEDDRRDQFGRDQYLGDIRYSGDIYGNPPFADPYFAALVAPPVRKLEARLAEICPNWDRVRANLMEWWICAPKSFRFLERKLWDIGKERTGGPFDSEFPGTYEPVPDFLKCEDTYPNHDEAAAWWREFMQALDAWWQGTPVKGGVADEVNRLLGESTDLKRWLVRLYARRLRRLEENGEQLSRLVNPKHSHKRGRRPLGPGKARSVR